MMAVRGLVAAVERTGVERARFLAQAELEPARLDDVHTFVSLDEYGRVVRSALAITADPAFGLHTGERATMGSFDVLGHLSEHSRCLRDALEVGVRYTRIVSDGPQLELLEETDSATLRLTLTNWELPVVRLAAEFSTVSLLRLIRRFAGDAACVERVFFAYDAPEYCDEYTRVFEGREQFGHAFTGLQFDRAWLDRTQLNRSAELRALLEARAELLLAKVDQGAPAADRVKRWLASQSARTRPTMDDIARELGMSARSLRRKLREERTAFSALVSDALAIRAKRLLADPRCSIQETAWAMGFDTPSAFSRAFKRWTGMAPSRFRAPG